MLRRGGAGVKAKVRHFEFCFAIFGPGGYSIYPWVGRCGPAPYTATLFKTKIADFPTLFYTEFRFLIPCLRHLTRNHTLCKTIINIETLSYLKNYLQLDQQSRRLVRRTYARAVYRPRKDTLFKTKIDKNRYPDQL